MLTLVGCSQDLLIAEEQLSENQCFTVIVLWPARQHKSANLNFNDTFVALILDMYSVSLSSFCYFFVSRLIIARSYLHRSVLPSSGILLQNDWLILVIGMC
jgi:hypothetical protein